MVGLVEDGISALERMLTKTEERRVDTMIQIAFLEADNLNSIEARADLAAIEKLLKTMRKQRRLLAARVHLMRLGVASADSSEFAGIS